MPIQVYKGVLNVCQLTHVQLLMKRTHRRATDGSIWGLSKYKLSSLYLHITNVYADCRQVTTVNGAARGTAEERLVQLWPLAPS